MEEVRALRANAAGAASFAMGLQSAINPAAAPPPPAGGVPAPIEVCDKGVSATPSADEATTGGAAAAVDAKRAELADVERQLAAARHRLEEVEAATAVRLSHECLPRHPPHCNPSFLGSNTIM